MCFFIIRQVDSYFTTQSLNLHHGIKKDPAFGAVENFSEKRTFGSLSFLFVLYSFFSRLATYNRRFIRPWKGF